MATHKAPELEPSELWKALTSVPRPKRIVDLPRSYPEDFPDQEKAGKAVGQIAIWPLTQEELMICNAEADRFTKALLKDPQKRDEANFGYEHTFGNDNAIQILFRACRDAKDLKKAAFPSTKMMRQELTTDEIGALFNMYLTVQVEVGPIVHHLSVDEMEALVRRIEEGGSAFPFNLLSLETQTSLLHFMASELVSYWTGTSSVGSPPDEPPLEDPVAAPEEAPPLAMPEE